MVILICLLSLLLANADLVYASEQWQKSDLFRSFSALYTTYPQLQKDYQDQKKNLSAKEVQAYQHYLKQLQQTLTQQCQQLSKTYPSFPAQKYACTPPISMSAAQAKQQHLKQLQRQFTEDLSKIDELLLEEQKKIAKKINTTASTANTNVKQSSQTKIAQEQNSNKTKTFASGKQSTGNTKSEVHGNQNDDIVARQLREAAEKETNPELKRKLWEEYRRYKSSL